MNYTVLAAPRPVAHKIAFGLLSARRYFSASTASAVPSTILHCTRISQWRHGSTGPVTWSPFSTWLSGWGRYEEANICMFPFCSLSLPSSPYSIDKVYLGFYKRGVHCGNDVASWRNFAKLANCGCRRLLSVFGCAPWAIYNFQVDLHPFLKDSVNKIAVPLWNSFALSAYLFFVLYCCRHGRKSLQVLPWVLISCGTVADWHSSSFFTSWIDIYLIFPVGSLFSTYVVQRCFDEGQRYLLRTFDYGAKKVSIVCTTLVISTPGKKNTNTSFL